MPRQIRWQCRRQPETNALPKHSTHHVRDVGPGVRGGSQSRADAVRPAVGQGHCRCRSATGSARSPQRGKRGTRGEARGVDRLHRDACSHGASTFESGTVLSRSAIARRSAPARASIGSSAVRTTNSPTNPDAGACAMAMYSHGTSSATSPPCLTVETTPTICTVSARPAFDERNARGRSDSR